GDQHTGPTMIGDGHGVHAARTDGEEPGAVVTRVGLEVALGGVGARPVHDVPRRTEAVESGQRPRSGGLEAACITFGATAPRPLDRARTWCFERRGWRWVAAVD